MRSTKAMTLIMALALGGSAVAKGPDPVARAIAHVAARSPENVKLDEGRKPAQLLAFLGLKPGMRVLDLFGGNRYWAEIMAPAVGPKGQVIVWQPTQFMNDKRAAEFAAFRATQKNAALMSSPFEAPTFAPNSYDFALMNLDYHDLYWENAKNRIPRQEPDVWLKKLYAAMRPGATVGIVDHVASAGSDVRQTVDKLHRIDPAVVRADFERAGFRLEAESKLLRNPADDHSLNVFDEKIRGRTDRVVYKFRKPA